jgi:hypothetical protein
MITGGKIHPDLKPVLLQRMMIVQLAGHQAAAIK